MASTAASARAGAGEGQQLHGQVERDRDDGAKRRAARHAKRVGVGEGVAHQRLEQHARQRQCATGDRGEQHAGQPGDEKDFAVRERPAQTRP